MEYNSFTYFDRFARRTCTRKSMLREIAAVIMEPKSTAVSKEYQAQQVARLLVMRTVSARTTATLLHGLIAYFALHAISQRQVMEPDTHHG